MRVSYVELVVEFCSLRCEANGPQHITSYPTQPLFMALGQFLELEMYFSLNYKTPNSYFICVNLRHKSARPFKSSKKKYEGARDAQTVKEKAKLLLGGSKYFIKLLRTDIEAVVKEMKTGKEKVKAGGT